MPFQSKDIKSLEKTDKFILPVDKETVSTTMETNAEDLLSRMERSVSTITKARPHLSSDKATNGEINNYKTLLQISALVNSSLVTDDILQVVMKRAIEMLKAERGFLMLLDENNQLQFRTVYNLCKEELMQEDFKFSGSVANLVASTGESVYTSDAQNDERYSNRNSIAELNLRSKCASR